MKKLSWYVFKYDDNEGFSVVSASTNTAPLIAYVEDGHYDIDYSNDGFILYMNSAIEYVRKSYTNNTYYIGDMPVRTKTENVFVTTDEVKPKIEVNCGPTQWEGYYCPNSDAGSLAIAVAQILSYYEHPSWVEDYEPQYEYPGGPPLLKYLDWEDLKKHSISKHDTNFTKPGQQFISCNASNESHKALSCICREIADRCGSNYTSEGTFVSSPDIPNVFLNYFDQCAYHLFAYNEEAHNYDLENSNSSFASKELLSVDDAISDLSSGFLILYSVNKNDQLYYWAADGYKVVDIVANVYVEVKKDNMWGTQWELLESHKTGEAQFIHINWGDYGRCNGYFLFTDIHPEAGIEYDNSKLDSWCNNYVMNNKIRIYGINIEIL